MAGMLTVYVKPEGVPAVVTKPAPVNVLSVNVVVPLVAEIR